MSIFFYNIFLLLFRAGALIATLFDPKAKLWIKGRKDIFKSIKSTINTNEKKIWIHCASLGEFEQGRPVIEKIRSEYNEYKILLTFFSPSGFEVQKNYSGADWVFYLPLDGADNANRFLEIVNPDLVIFVKYEYWYYYLKKIKERKIPLLLISALFRKDMVFFKWYGGIYRKMLAWFDYLYVQNNESKKLIGKFGFTEKCIVSGDTRYDRVIEIASSSKMIPEVEQFLVTNKCIVAGSTWPEDEIVLANAMSRIRHSSLKLIIAPHEVNEKHLTSLKKLMPSSLLYSELKNGVDTIGTGNILIIDTIGILSLLYKQGTIAYVGGGLKPTGVHNVLEAAVYGKPVLFGPHYHEYAEAVELVKAGGGLPFNDEKRNGLMLSELIDALLVNQEEYNYRSEASYNFVQSNKGATAIILNHIQENRLLTRLSKC